MPKRDLLAKAKLDAFAANPPALFGSDGKGEGKLAADVRNLAATSRSTLPGLAALIKAANGDQVRAIGAGLGQAALLCGKVDPDLARAIQETIVGADRVELLASYQSVVHEQISAALDDEDTTASTTTIDVQGESIPGGAPNRGSNDSGGGGGFAGGSPLTFFAIGGGSGGSRRQSRTSYFVNTTGASALQSVSPSR